MVSQPTINPLYPLRSALISLMKRPKCHWVEAEELACAAGVALSRAQAYLSILHRSHVIELCEGKAVPTCKWAYFIESTEGRTPGPSTAKKTALTKDQLQHLREIRSEAAREFALLCNQGRDLLGFTHTQLAGEAGVTLSAVHKVLKGEHLAPAFTLVQVAAALGVDLAPLFLHLKKRICAAMQGPVA